MNRYLPVLYVVTAVLAIALSIMATRSLHNFYHRTDFSPPPKDESGAVGSQPARPALISCLDLQRELNRLYPEAKLVEDGICGEKTMYWWNWHCFNQYVLETWPVEDAK